MEFSNSFRSHKIINFSHWKFLRNYIIWWTRFYTVHCNTYLFLQSIYIYFFNFIFFHIFKKKNFQVTFIEIKVFQSVTDLLKKSSHITPPPNFIYLFFNLHSFLTSFFPFSAFLLFYIFFPKSSFSFEIFIIFHRTVV